MSARLCALAVLTSNRNQVGDINKEKLPGPDALQNPGKKDGQVIMVRNGEIVEAHMWSNASKAWTNVGQVVDSVGSGRKRLYEGKEYDFVFDVDIQEGVPPLKLPYNASENPFDAARKFLEKNELPLDYLDTVGKFIVTNSGGVEIGQSAPVHDSSLDPWGTGMDAPSKASTPAPTPKVLPQKEYLSIVTANLVTVEKKTRQINDQLIAEGNKDVAMGDTELGFLAELCKYLGQAKPEGPLATSCVDLLAKLVKTWPAQHRLPVLDLLRLAAGVSPKVADLKLVELFKSSNSFSKEFSNNSMLAVRAFVNLFQTEEGRKYSLDHFDEVCLTFALRVW